MYIHHVYTYKHELVSEMLCMIMSAWSVKNFHTKACMFTAPDVHIAYMHASLLYMYKHTSSR